MRWWVIGLGLCAGMARADDSWIGTESGSPYPLTEHPSIRMVREDVDLYLPSMRVEARFVFRNEGPACTVRMGFPETGGGEGGNGDIRPKLSRFQSRVDGRRLRRTWIPTRERNGQWTGFWATKLRFGRGQTRVVTDRFTASGWGDSQGIDGLDYILTSGANWKGPIGYGRIVCHLQDRRGWSYRTTPDSRQTESGQLVYEFRDLHPTENFCILWRPWFECITVNGQARDQLLWAADVDGDAHGAARKVPARKQGDRVNLSLVEACALLGIRYSGRPTADGYRVQLVREGRVVELREGSALAAINGRMARLRQPPRRDHGWLSICLQDLIDLFGGTWRWNADPWGLVVDLPTLREHRPAKRGPAPDSENGKAEELPQPGAK